MQENTREKTKDPRLSTAFRKAVLAQLRRQGITVTELADRTGYHRVSLSRQLHSDGDVGLDDAVTIGRAVGLRVLLRRR